MHNFVPGITLPASFRDPDGHLFYEGGRLLRSIAASYKPAWDMLMATGLYARLTDNRQLIPHTEITDPANTQSWRVIEPELVGFVSYPYEWSFSQLQDAALLTLDIQLTALEHGMTLKDASAYNVQFHKGLPTFIDTLSFEPYQEGSVWVAYYQFCQHFLAPLALAAKTDIRLTQLLRVYIDGVPLNLASKLLSPGTWFDFGLLAHVHLHAKSQAAWAGSDKAVSERTKKLSQLSKTGLVGLLQGLRKAVAKLQWNPTGTEWGDYYKATNYSDAAFMAKHDLVRSFLTEASPRGVWDLGGNIGVFSRIASGMGIPTLSFDIDPAAVETSYRKVRHDAETLLLPLVLDLTNPSPGIGWCLDERPSVLARGPADCVMALALIHHLAISNNVPLPQLARFFARVAARYLIIEFVPKDDSQVLRLLRSRKDVFPDYHTAGFEQAFAPLFSIKRAEPVSGSKRTLYLLELRK